MAIVNEAIISNGTGGATDYRYTMLTVPAGEEWAITNIMVCNTYDPAGVDAATADCAFDLHFVPSDGSYSDTITSVVRRLNLPAGETFTFDTEKVVLEGGDSVVVNGSADTTSPTAVGRLACTVSYIKVL
jgi:hypothetical protein